MKNITTTLSSTLCTFSVAVAVALPLCDAAHATDAKVMTNAAPAASAASGSTARRTLKFDTRHAVPATLKLSGDTAISDGYEAQFRFSGQTEQSACKIKLPKVGQQVQPGETAVGAIQCSTPWQVYDNGLSFEAFQGGRKVGEGTLRP